MTIQKKSISCMVTSILVTLWLSVMYCNENNKVIVQQNIIDSLKLELFEANVEIGRHELSREEILKPNKLINKQYEEYYNHKTE